MPTYDYKCDLCDHAFEIFQSMNDAPLMKCEKCGGGIRRLFNASGIIFKGSGFYVNDYKKDGSPSSSTKSSHEGGPCGCCGSNPVCETKE
jgi:putative FmdB family regulatory protein